MNTGMKTKALALIQDTSTISISMLLAALMLLSGCEALSTHHQDTLSLAPPPPFHGAPDSGANLSVVSTTHSVMNLATIEPASGAAVAVVTERSVSSSCRERLGINGGSDALYYQWDGNRFGLNFDATSGSMEDDSARATLRYSISLQRKPCG